MCVIYLWCSVYYVNETCLFDLLQNSTVACQCHKTPEISKTKTGSQKCIRKIVFPLLSRLGKKWRHDIHHNDTNLSKRYTNYHIYAIMLSVAILSAIIQSVVMLNATLSVVIKSPIIPSVVTPRAIYGECLCAECCGTKNNLLSFLKMKS